MLLYYKELIKQFQNICHLEKLPWVSSDLLLLKKVISLEILVDKNKIKIQSKKLVLYNSEC